MLLSCLHKTSRLKKKKKTCKTKQQPESMSSSTTFLPMFWEAKSSPNGERKTCRVLTQNNNGSCEITQLFSRPKVSKSRSVISQEPFLQGENPFLPKCEHIRQVEHLLLDWLLTRICIGVKPTMKIVRTDVCNFGSSWELNKLLLCLLP